MVSKKMLRWAALLTAMMWLATGCADGVLFQREYADGGMNRLRIDAAEGWGDYDTTPRSRSQKAKDQDSYGIMMKNEATF